MEDMPLTQYKPLYDAVKAFISSNYVDALAGSIDDSQTIPFMAGIVRRYLLDNQYPDDKQTQILSARLVEDCAGIGFLSRYIYRDGFQELNINEWNQAKCTINDEKSDVPETFLSPKHAQDVIRRILNRCGKTIDEAIPTARAQLGNSIRITASLHPIVNSVAASIRYVNRNSILDGNVVESGMATREEFDFIMFCLRYRIPIVFAGETGAGKTFIANASLHALNKEDRIITLEEDWREFYLPGHEWVSKITRPSKIPDQNIDLAKLIRLAVTEHPDYIGIGEITSYEAFQALRAARTHPVVTTTHSTSAIGTYPNLMSLCQLYPDISIRDETLMGMLVDAFPIVVYLQQCDDEARRVMEIREAYGYSARAGIQSNCIFRFDTDSVVQTGGKYIIHGKHRRVGGISETFQSRLRSKNAPVGEIEKYAGKESDAA